MPATKRKTAKKATSRKTKKAPAKKTVAKKKPAAKKKTTARKTTAKKKPAAKKSTARKTTAKRKPAAKKKAPARKTAAKRKPAAKKATKSNVSVKETLTKTQLMRTLAEMTDLSKKDVEAVFEAMGELMQASLKKRGPRKFVLPGVVKFEVVRKKARPARKGINPFTGEEMMFKAKPAQDVLKARLLKAAKDMIDA